MQYGATAPGDTVTLQWESVGDASYYWLCVNDVDSPWTGTREYTGDVGNVTSYDVTGLADDGTTYYWWVWGGNGGGISSWSEVSASGRSFINGAAPPSPPAAPSLVSPADGATAPGGTVTLQWDSVGDASYYWLCVNDVDSPLTGTREFTGDVGNVTSYDVTGLANDGTTYYWWVWGGNGGGISPWSEVSANHRSFIN